MRKFLIAAALLSASAPAFATDYQSSMQAYLDSGAAAWTSEPSVVAAVAAANETTAGYSEAEIIAMDTAWRAEVGTADTALVDSVLDNGTADFLRQVVADSGGIITEIILMDAQGLNVAVSHVTSDYWQGDEAKHQETYGVGPDAVHFGDVELDESSQRYQGQISLTLVDPETGDAIGAVTIGVDAQALL
ncbi:hypothetical protein KUL25_16570 [Rhodobacteraceae bacterium N5(2021)]|uniref:Uncharacterized protein n=1 Tax=Gymnodinialimonas phycosphaerae TaxID=2841589 RepID=A0A975YF39_9RHOB|nr:hypothetical protein [Gymnodinialimonas phycosphaerae]MBY4894372.1 hypothetical protein [Gymnodinialimonas phycosphaerae]